jgi:hypothetical protein
MCEDRVSIKDGPDARAVSDIARRVLAALGYDITRLHFQNGFVQKSVPGKLAAEERTFDDPRVRPPRARMITITDFYSQEASGVQIHIGSFVGQGDKLDGIEHLNFYYDRIRGSLMSTRDYNLRETEAVATNFLTQRTFHGPDAFDSVGALRLAPQPTIDPLPNLLRMHEAVVRVLSQPRITPAPGLAPIPGP